MPEPVDAPIVWDTASLCVLESDQHDGWAGPDAPPGSVGLEPSSLGRLVQRFPAWRRMLRRSLFLRQQCDGPLETTRRVASSLDDAMAVLDRIDSIDWNSTVGTGHLDLEPFRSTPGEAGIPWVASAVLRGRRTRRLNVSVAIFTWGSGRCGIAIRPRYRRPWSRRRLRRCLNSTHAAADRLCDIVLATDVHPTV